MLDERTAKVRVLAPKVEGPKHFFAVIIEKNNHPNGSGWL
jgi:hypothetical protein